MNTTSNTKTDKIKAMIAEHKYRAISTLCDLNEVFSAGLAEASNTVTASELNPDQSEAYAKLIDLEWEMERLANSLTKAHQAAMKIMSRRSAT
jgi:hypothetical protein